MKSFKKSVVSALLLSSISSVTIACSTATSVDSPTDTSANTVALSNTAAPTEPPTQISEVKAADNVQPKENEKPDFSMLEANATYEAQDFSETLYAQFLETESWCIATGECGIVRYLFNDVLLMSSVGEFGSTEIKVIPHQAVSKPQALRYAQILDSDDIIDFSEGMIEDGYEGEYQRPETVYESFFQADLPEEGAAYSMGSAKMVRLALSPNGDVSEISLIMTVF